MRRDQLMHFVDTSMCGTTPSYVLLGDGIASLSEEMNAETETKQWINQRNGTTQVKGYTPSIEVEREDCVDDDCRAWIKRMIDELPTGAAAVTYVVRVDATGTPTSGAYPAIRRKFAVQVGSTGGDAGGDVVDSITLGGCGDGEVGTFNPTTLTFTATP